MRKLDHTPEKTRRIVARAGCSINESVTLYDGGVAFEVTCPSHSKKVDMLGALAEADAELPDVRRIAEDVTARSHDDAERIAKLHAFVLASVSFLKEKRETFSTTLRTLEIGQGDCDDSSRVMMALLRALDIPARLETIPSRASGAVPVHVAAQAQLNGEWQWLETTIQARPGEHPLAASARLGVTSRADLAGLGQVMRSRSGREVTLLDEATEWVAPAMAVVALGVLWWMHER